MKLVLATQNSDKIKEIRAAWIDLPIEIVTLENDATIKMPEETGETLRENALLKAREVARQTGGWALGDDTGLKVAALNGAPGVYSARYAGPQATYQENRRKLLEALQRTPENQRGAYFSCWLALCHPDGREVVVEGRVEGLILAEDRGDRGFGYDAIFYLPTLRKTLAEISMEEKNQISHRGVALRKMGGVIKGLLKIEKNGV